MPTGLMILAGLAYLAGVSLSAPRGLTRGRIIGAIGFAVGFAIGLSLIDAARADERGAWFKSLVDREGKSCCDISDCKRTEADWKDGHWEADVRGLKRPIPPEKVLDHPRSIDGEAYVCATDIGNPAYATIYCFIPPNMGF